MPPKPIERMNGTGTTTSASRPMPTVVPLNTIARPLVAIAASIASSPSSPFERSSRQRITSSSE